MPKNSKKYIKQHIVFLHIIMPILIIVDLICILLTSFGTMQGIRAMYTASNYIGILGVVILDNYFKQVFIVVRDISNKNHISDYYYNEYKSIINESSYGMFIIYLFISGILECILSMAALYNNSDHNILQFVMAVSAFIINALVVGNAISTIHVITYDSKQIEKRRKDLK